MATQYEHTPVMLKEVLEFLSPGPGQNFIDCTLGGGGYTFAIAEKIAPAGKIISIDLDNKAIANAEKTIKQNKYQNIILVNENFKNLSNIVKNHWPGQQAPEFDGIVFDLGLSSDQLKDRNRGFSFQLDAPLDMAFGQLENEHRATKHIINYWKQENLEALLYKFGEERYAKRIAASIVRARQEEEIKTTGRLVEIIASAVPAVYKRGKIHFATRTFQALRIAANRELENLRTVLPQAVDLLKTGGRLAVVSYHSLEDRIVKKYIKEERRACICPPSAPVCVCGHVPRLKIITPKIIKPGEEEVIRNPRARSAKLRVAEKLNTF